MSSSMYFKIAQNILKGLRNILELDLRSKNHQHVILPFTIQQRGGEGGICAVFGTLNYFLSAFTVFDWFGSTITKCQG